MAAQFPPELFENVLHFACGDGRMSFFTQTEQDYRYEPSLELSKRELGACSLVCRYWARHVRPNIFDQLTIRSRDDFLAFIALAKSTVWSIDSGFRVGMYVKRLSVEQDIHSPTWIHLLFHFFPHRLMPHLQSNDPTTAIDGIEITFSGTGDSNGSRLDDNMTRCAPPTIYHGLPRQLPLPLSPVEQVNLTNTAFRSFNGFVSFVSGIAAKSLDITSVGSLDTELLDPHIPPKILRTKPRQVPKGVSVHNCGLSWPFIWMVTTCRFPLIQSWRRGYTPAVYVIPEELVKLATLIKCVFDDCECVLCSHQGSTDDDTVKRTSFFGVTGPDLHKPSNQQSTVLRIYKRVDNWIHAMLVTLSLQGSITALAIQVYSPGGDHDTNIFSRPHEFSINWRTIDTLASHFTTSTPNPWALEIRTGTNSVDDMRAFAPYVRSQMPLMQTAGRLVFSFGGWDRKEARYYNWKQWTKELEHVEDEKDGANGEASGNTETAAVGSRR